MPSNDRQLIVYLGTLRHIEFFFIFSVFISPSFLSLTVGFQFAPESITALLTQIIEAYVVFVTTHKVSSALWSVNV